MARKLNDRWPDLNAQAVYMWTRSGAPSKYCPDIEALTGVRCEDLQPDVNWSVLRTEKVQG